uniref:Uncharacterized protein n=1 Tax=Parascaris equorum TaxID=6256 RepID=A0A914RFH6_PAREQ
MWTTETNLRCDSTGVKAAMGFPFKASLRFFSNDDFASSAVLVKMLCNIYAIEVDFDPIPGDDDIVADAAHESTETFVHDLPPASVVEARFLLHCLVPFSFS